MGTTPNYGLTIPTDPNAQADLIVIVGALGNDTDRVLKQQVDALNTGLDTKSPTTHTHPYSPNTHTHAYSPVGHGHDYAATNHGHPYAPSTHNHNASQSGIYVGTAWIGNLSAGQQKTITIGKAPGEYIIFSSAHPSTYIFWALQQITDTSFTLEARNSTNGTNHTSVQAYYARIANR